MISLIAMAVPTADGLYRWHVQTMEQRPDPVEALSSQRKRFTPSLFALLLQASEQLDGAAVNCVSVDIPLATAPIIRGRRADTAISSRFGTKNTKANQRGFIGKEGQHCPSTSLATELLS